MGLDAALYKYRGGASPALRLPSPAVYDIFLWEILLY